MKKTAVLGLVLFMSIFAHTSKTQLKKQQKPIMKYYINDHDLLMNNNQQFMKLMDISKRTAQDWRDKKVIDFIQIGNKIYYKLSDVQKLLNDNYNSKK